MAEVRSAFSSWRPSAACPLSSTVARDWKTTGATEDEVMKTIGEHAAQVHPEIDLTPDLIAAVRNVIKDD